MSRAMFRLWVGVIVLEMTLGCPSGGIAEEIARVFRPGQYAGAELSYVEHIPVLKLSGTARERGRQMALVAQDVLPALINYPEQLYTALGDKKAWAKHLQLVGEIRRQFPAEHLEELVAMAEAAGVSQELVLAVNTLPDLYRGCLGCSSIVVEASRSSSGSAVFGRNLDFFGLGTLHKFGLVVIYRPAGKHAFVTVTFPGFLGCLSGMNDAGLALAVHEAARRSAEEPMADVRGIPQGFLCRKVLEDCASVDEAVALIGSCYHTSPYILMLCDTRKHAVVEIVPGQVAVRHEIDGVAACTNHFRTALAGVAPFCERYEKLMQAKEHDRIGIAEVISLLHAVNQGELTIQSMIFEPERLRLHLSLGPLPATKGPFVALELGHWLGKDQAGQ